MRKRKKSKTELVQRWLEKARRDLLTSKRGLQGKEPFTDIVCFHAQQAAEKSLKAYLIWHEVDFPRTHAVEDLVLLAAQRDSEFLALKDQAATLTPHAVESRYPEFEAPALDDAREAVTVADHIRDIVLRRLPQAAKEKTQT